MTTRKVSQLRLVESLLRYPMVVVENSALGLATRILRRVCGICRYMSAVSGVFAGDKRKISAPDRFDNFDP